MLIRFLQWFLFSQYYFLCFRLWTYRPLHYEDDASVDFQLLPELAVFLRDAG